MYLGDIWEGNEYTYKRGKSEKLALVSKFHNSECKGSGKKSVLRNPPWRVWRLGGEQSLVLVFLTPRNKVSQIELFWGSTAKLSLSSLDVAAYTQTSKTQNNAKDYFWRVFQHPLKESPIDKAPFLYLCICNCIFGKCRPAVSIQGGYLALPGAGHRPIQQRPAC